jgi:hypothetical protein
VIYVFEDKRDDVLSDFYRKAYPQDIGERFVYTNGNGNILDKVGKILELTNETIVVFLDFYPSNDSIVRIYKKLSHLSRNNNNRLVVMPIVCAEYYMLRLLKKNDMIIDKRSVDTALEFGLYDEILVSDEDRKFCTTFEKYCKLVLMKSVKECVSTKGKCTYYREDCLCQMPADSECKENRLVDKASGYVGEYPCSPKGSYSSEKNYQTIDDIWNRHRELVDMFNNIADKMEKIDSGRKYRRVSPIM